MQAFLEGTASPTEVELAYFEELAPGSRKLADSFIWDMLKGNRLPKKTIDAAIALDLREDSWDQLEFLAAFLYDAHLRSDAVDVVRTRISIATHLCDSAFEGVPVEELDAEFKKWSPSPAQRQGGRL
jgi:hypothetical protein